MWKILTESTKGKKLKRIGYCYLHGELETDCEHDVFYLTNAPDLAYRADSKHYVKIEDGIYPAIYNNKACTIFVWSGLDGQKGLAVYNSDIKAYHYASKAYATKQCSI